MLQGATRLDASRIRQPCIPTLRKEEKRQEKFVPFFLDPSPRPAQHPTAYPRRRTSTRLHRRTQRRDGFFLIADNTRQRLNRNFSAAGSHHIPGSFRLERPVYIKDICTARVTGRPEKLAHTITVHCYNTGVHVEGSLLSPPSFNISHILFPFELSVQFTQGLLYGTKWC